MEIFLNLLAIFSITFVVANLSLSTAFSLISQHFLKIEVRPRRLLLWLFVLLPWIISLAISLYIVQSYHTGNEIIGYGFPHWHHMTDFEWASWHGVTVGLSLMLVAYVIVRKFSDLWRHNKEVDALLGFATELGDGLYKVESSNASAFTTGFVSKKCVVTTGLIEQTSEEEYNVVVSHEKAHALANDPFKKWLFALLSEFFIKPVRERLKLHMNLAMENEADNAVINSGVSKLFVASTLVKIAKLNAQNNVLKHNDLVANFGADVLEQRIYFLLGKLKLTPVHKGITTILVFLLVAISTTSIDGIHHFMESLFKH